MLSDLAKRLALRVLRAGVAAPTAQAERFYELQHLRRLLTLLDVDCVIDVGANRGQFARELRGIGYRGRIVSFEPIGSEFAIMERAFADDPHWRGLRMALGREETTLPIRVAAMSVMSSFLTERGGRAAERTEEVTVGRLDRLFPSLVEGLADPRVFLKLDTQGFDLEVFAGAAGCLDHIAGLQAELSVQPLYEAAPDYLEALGAYEAAGLELYNLSVVNRLDDGAILELNAFMRRRA
ncbi:MAG: FkbM family methyltransferase [Alphaproteobacteria bacterium]|nr:FkbM family methyltransferase [Alphaproteobacteria bacterium]